MNILEIKNQIDILTNIIFQELINLSEGRQELEQLAWEFRLVSQENLSSILQRFREVQNERAKKQK